MSGGEFLAGLLSALSDSYGQVQAENKRISLLKQQMDQQRSIAEQQLALAREGQSQRSRIEERQLDIQEKLGSRRLDIDEKGQDQEAAQADKRHQLAILLQAMQGAQQQGNTKLEGQLRNEAMRLQAELQSSEADRGVVRQQALMSYEHKLRQAGENYAEKRQIRGEKRAEDAQIRAETRKSSADSDAEDRQMVKALIGKVANYAIDRPEEYANAVKSLELGVFDAAAKADFANPAGKAMSRVRGMLEQIDSDLEAGREAAASGSMSSQALDAIKALRTFKNDPEGALQSILISKAGPQDWSKVGQARPGMTIDLTAKPPSDAPAANTPFKDDLGFGSVLRKEDFQNRITTDPRWSWVKDAMVREKEHRKQAAGWAPMDMFGGRDWMFDDQLLNEIQTAPGSDWSSKIQNAISKWPSYIQTAVQPPTPPRLDLRRGKK